MGLSEDQKAMLRLLAQSDGRYEDIAAVMGISVEEARARVKQALADQDEEATEEKPPPAPEPAPPPEPEAKEEPAPEPLPPAPEAATPSPAKAPRQGPGLSLPKERGALIGIGAGVIVLIALAIVLALSGGDSSDSGSASSEPTAAENAKLTQAVLSPVDGSDASGRALFGRIKDSVVLQVEAEGLDPVGKGESYAIWLARSPELMLPLAVARDDSGKIAAQYPLPSSVLAYLASGTFDEIAISRVSNAPYKAALVKAGKDKKAPTYTGDDVLRGTVTGPIVGAAKKGN